MVNCYKYIDSRVINIHNTKVESNILLLEYILLEK